MAGAVHGNGTGITEDVLSRIFDPFFTTRDGALVAGLGLPLAADVARSGGGDLTVETKFGNWDALHADASVEDPTRGGRGPR